MAKANATRAKFELDWSAVIWSGLIAGLIFLMAEMGMVAAMGESPWGPPRMMAAMVMGKEVLPPPATFDITILMVAMMIHFVMSIGLAAIFAIIVRGWGRPMTLVAGAVFGLVIYGVNFYGFTAIFPWFAMARNIVTIASHVIFGLALAYTYNAFRSR